MTEHTCTLASNARGPGPCLACQELFAQGKHWSQQPGQGPARPLAVPDASYEDLGSIGPLAVSDADDGPRALSTKEVAEGLTGISKVVDSLVKRITGSGRQHSEHILDEARSQHEEEIPIGAQVSVRCDRCGLKGPGAGSIARASELAEAQGWYVSNEKDHCVTCRDDRKLLPGMNAIALAESLPKEIAIVDQIFLTRIEWLRERIESGATVVATILNARRSGHRPMLTDLAQRFGYDSVLFFERLQDLIDRDQVKDDLWLQAADSSEGEEEPKHGGVVFMRKLFQLLRVEDEDA